MYKYHSNTFDVYSAVSKAPFKLEIDLGFTGQENKAPFRGVLPFWLNLIRAYFERTKTAVFVIVVSGSL